MLKETVQNPEIADDSAQGLSAPERALRLLRHKLSGGEWQAGDKLPSEPALAETLGVSRNSVRSALAHLDNEGIISRRHGSGTYVNSVRPLVHSLHQNVGTDELIRSSGHIPGIAEMIWRRTEADEEIAEKLSLDVGAEIIELYRVRTSDGKPVCVEHDYFSASLVPEDHFTMSSSLYEFLSMVCGVNISFGVADLKPGIIGPRCAEALSADSGSPCLILSQVDYTADELPVSYSIEYHLAEAFRFQLVRQGPNLNGSLLGSANLKGGGVM